jgi:hypothetical protein
MKIKFDTYGDKVAKGSHKVFAWFPVYTRDNCLVWLEPVYRKYRLTWFDLITEYSLKDDF